MQCNCPKPGTLMEKDFYQYIFEKQQFAQAVPSNTEMADWAQRVISLLFPERANHVFNSPEQIKDEFKVLLAEYHR